MKKVIKKFLIIILSIIALGSFYLYFTILAWQGLSAQEKLGVIEYAYEECRAQGGQNCEQKIAEQIEDYIDTQKIEFIDIIQDKQMPGENRILALSMFFNFCRGNEILPISPETDFYYALAIDQGNPFDLRQLAFSYFLEGQLGDAETENLQELIIGDQEAHPDFQEMVVKNLNEEGMDKNKEKLLENLKNPDSEVRFEIAEFLGQEADQKWLLDLLEIAQEKGGDLRGRALALLAIEGLVERGEGGEDYSELMVSVEPLLKHEESVIKLGAEGVWEALTGEGYLDNVSAEEIDDYITDVFLGDY
ncbi:HEAT repeat domain-containing protein [Patescibacteria group bacterium]|nr:HEAT repeat domain-containing protein [Patescibacteria group bacterium]